MLHCSFFVAMALQKGTAMGEIWAENWHFILLILAIAGIWFYNTFIAPLIVENEEKRRWQNIAEPVLILQGYETDDEFLLSAERARERFRQSGNKFAERQTPVIAIPYNGYFEIEWFGEKQYLSTVGMGRMEYLLQSLEMYKKLYFVWAKQVHGAHGERIYNEKVNKQKPFTENDRETVWQN